MTALIFFTTAAYSSIDKLYHVENAQSYQQKNYELTDRFKHKQNIATHLWSNKNSKLMVVAHGYGDNCGYVKPIHKWLLENNYDVFCIELPGHGESSGARADIYRIEVYQDVFSHMITKASKLPYKQFDYYGHSTGNIGLTLMLLDGEKHPFNKIVMAAPLIRSYLWKISKLGLKIFGRIIKRLPRRNKSKNIPAYKKIAQYDPKPIKTIPTNWPIQLINWNTRLAKLKATSYEKISFIFGNKDTIIDYAYNKKFMQKHFPQSDFYILKGSDHVFHYEKKTIQEKFYSHLAQVYQ